MIKNRTTLAALLMTSALTIAACSSVPETQTSRTDVKSVNDPMEGMNRVVFDVNDFLDRLLIRPITELYGILIPPPIRERVALLVKNMGEPVNFANNLMQGEVSKAGTTLGRFLVNTTLGAGGTFEVANEFGLQKQAADFGQTLHTWGVGEGPYLVLPLFGPSNLRDAVGKGVDSVMSPWGYVANIGDSTISDSFTISSITASGLVAREENLEAMDALREGSLDFYAQMRSVYRQYRAKQLGTTAVEETVRFDEE